MDMDDHVSLQPEPSPGPPQVAIPADLLQAAISYLAQRPAGEVYHLLGGLLALQRKGPDG